MALDLEAVKARVNDAATGADLDAVTGEKRDEGKLCDLAWGETIPALVSEVERLRLLAVEVVGPCEVCWSTSWTPVPPDAPGAILVRGMHARCDLCWLSEQHRTLRATEVGEIRRLREKLKRADGLKESCLEYRSWLDEIFTLVGGQGAERYVDAVRRRLRETR